MLEYDSLESRPMTSYDFDKTKMGVQQKIPNQTSVANRESNEVSAKTASLLINAELLLKYNEPDLALSLLREACNRDSYNQLSLTKLAQTLHVLKRFDEEVRLREVVLRNFPSFENHACYARALYSINQDKEATREYLESLLNYELNESDKGILFEIYKNLGNIFVRSQDYEAAEEYFNKAHTLNTHSDVLLVNFGTLEIQRGDYEKAKDCFRRAVEKNNKNDCAWVGLSLIHNHFGDQPLAKANLENALDINPLNKTGLLLGANWSLRDNITQLWIVRLCRYLEVHNFDEEVTLVLVNFLIRNNDFYRAALEIEKSVLWHPERPDLWVIRDQINKLIHENNNPPNKGDISND